MESTVRLDIEYWPVTALLEWVFARRSAIELLAQKKRGRPTEISETFGLSLAAVAGNNPATTL